ncbi:LOW QUALITY PROTEIN: serine/threonine-protein kinase LMTK3-like, partial [Agelaius phoeniceus]|uniref:LOW QUALITY PROTEIN: serine/threonine-protein kinase LMTK3-like n=1 Tax=Agelaius phoeniceus TaxID=39638 RepID=UPI0040551D08
FWAEFRGFWGWNLRGFGAGILGEIRSFLGLPRTLRHPNLLRCLGGCRERPLLLVWEYCQMGDLKRYLRAQRGQAGGGAGGVTGGVAGGVASSPAPPPGRDLGTLERLALEVTRGLRHLHQHGFVHSDLALRNVLLTSELTARIGDYGLGPAHYREDYFVTPERALVPLRWVAPELVTKGARGTLEVAPQSRESNVWALGVTLWELLEWGAQPLPHLSDLQLLGRLRSRRPPALPPPRAAPAWSELLQSCRLPPPQRPTLDQLHARLSSLLARRPQTSPTLPPPLSPPQDAQASPVSPFPAAGRAAGHRGRADGHSGRARGRPGPRVPLGARPAPRRGHRGHRGWHRHRGHRRRPRAVPAGVLPVLGARSPSGTSEFFVRLEEHGAAAVTSSSVTSSSVVTSSSEVTKEPPALAALSPPGGGRGGGDVIGDVINDVVVVREVLSPEWGRGRALGQEWTLTQDSSSLGQERSTLGQEWTLGQDQSMLGQERSSLTQGRTLTQERSALTQEWTLTQDSSSAVIVDQDRTLTQQQSPLGQEWTLTQDSTLSQERSLLTQDRSWLGQERVIIDPRLNIDPKAAIIGSRPANIGPRPDIEPGPVIVDPGPDIEPGPVIIGQDQTLTQDRSSLGQDRQY